MPLSNAVRQALAEDRARQQAREQAVRRRTSSATTASRLLWLEAAREPARTVSRTLLRRAADEWRRANRASSSAIETGIQQAAAQGERAGLALLAAADADTGTVEQVGTQVLEEATREGSRLQRTLARRAAEGAGNPDRAAAILRDGFAKGLNPREVAANLSREFYLADYQNERISRTEMMRAHRETTRSIYEQQPGTVGWRWVIEESDRTCAACWAMEGTEHPTPEPMPAHPNCRCRMAPILKDPRADSFLQVPDGETQFARQPASVQRRVLGPGAYDLYQQGQISLRDVVTTRNDPTWGQSVTRVPLSRLA